MNPISKYLLAAAILFMVSSCNGQEKRGQNRAIIGGGCDGCELMYVGMPKAIASIDTSAGWREKGQKLIIKGKVFKPDGHTPAPNVIIYYWQTDNQGYYAPKQGMDERAKRHGHIRGWVKSDGKGNYAIYTIRPTPYPNENMPAHIHISIREAQIATEYYIDELVFNDDPFLTKKKRAVLQNRGGSGILQPLLQNNQQVAEHNIILGLNIPNYPGR